MNKELTKLLVFGMAFLFSKMNAQDIQWEKSYGGLQADYLFDALPTPDYGFILAGSSLSKKSGNKADNGHGDLDYWVWKMKENGDLDWQKSYGGDGADFLQTIKLTNDGGFILAGTSASAQTQSVGAENKGNTSFGGNDFWIVKLDAKGTVEWEKRYGGVGQDDLVTLSLTADGGYIIGGSSDSPSQTQTQNAVNAINPNAKYNDSRGNMDYWILKLDRKGNVTWQKTFGGDYADLLRAVVPTTDGGYMVGGYSNSPQSGDKTNTNFGEGGDYWILKLNDKGDIAWQQTIGGDKDDQLNALLQTPDKGYLLGGNSNSNATQSKSSNSEDGTDFWVLKLDEKGTPQWQKTYNYGTVDILTSMVQNPDGTVLVAGYSPSTAQSRGNKKAPEGLDDYIALKISPTGEVLWERKVGSDGVDMLKKVIETRDGGYLLAGTTNNSNNDSSSSKSGNNGIANNLGFNGENQQAANLKNQANQAVNQQVNDVNNDIKNQISQTGKALGLKEDSPLKLNSDALQLNSPLTLGGGNGGGNNNSNNSKPLPPSRDKSTGFGSTDFWVVKLKDKSKTEKQKASIEALPNPASTFTNIVVGYEYANGTATVVDLAGHQLASFAVNSRTIPVDLTNYPEGIYIITIALQIPQHF
jgi:hypothetical protein